MGYLNCRHLPGTGEFQVPKAEVRRKDIIITHTETPLSPLSPPLTEIISSSHSSHQKHLIVVCGAKEQERKESASGCQMLSEPLPGNNLLVVHLPSYPSGKPLQY
jgi:hypothetical protein